MPDRGMVCVGRFSGPGKLVIGWLLVIWWSVIVGSVGLVVCISNGVGGSLGDVVVCQSILRFSLDLVLSVVMVIVVVLSSASNCTWSPLRTTVCSGCLHMHFPKSCLHNRGIAPLLL